MSFISVYFLNIHSEDLKFFIVFFFFFYLLLLLLSYQSEVNDNTNLSLILYAVIYLLSSVDNEGHRRVRRHAYLVGAPGATGGHGLYFIAILY